MQAASLQNYIQYLDAMQHLHDIVSTLDHIMRQQHNNDPEGQPNNQNQQNSNQNLMESNQLAAGPVSQNQSQNVSSEQEILQNNLNENQQNELNQSEAETLIQQNAILQDSTNVPIQSQIAEDQQAQNQNENSLEQQQQQIQQPQQPLEQAQQNEHNVLPENQVQGNGNSNNSSNNEQQGSFMGLLFEGFVITNRVMVVSFRVRNPFLFGVPHDEPVQKEILEHIPIIIINEANQHEFSEQQCSICFENFKIEDNFMKTHCNHTFHQNCVKKWFDSHNTCPVCRQKIQKIVIISDEQKDNEHQQNNDENHNENDNLV